MKIIRKFDLRRAVKKPLADFRKAIDQGLVESMQYMGEDLTTYAKNNVGFISRTGNLLSSIGYVLIHGDAILHSGGFTRSQTKGRGLRAAFRFFRKKPKSVSLVIVAGMEYAAFVEAKGYAVLIPAELRARRIFKKRLDILMRGYLSKEQNRGNTNRRGG